MLARNQKLVGSLVVGLALAIVGCGDGTRSGNTGQGKRMFRNPAYPGSSPAAGVAAKGAGKDQSTTGTTNSAGGANLPVANAKDEKQIDARFDELTKVSKELPTFPAGSYDLASQISLAKLTFVKTGAANALSESQFVNGERKVVQTLSSGTLDQAVDSRSISIAMALDVDAGGKVTAPQGAEYMIDSAVETKSGKPVLNDVLSSASAVAPASISVLSLLNDPSHQVKDANGKTALLRILPQADGSILVWVAIEELAVNATGTQGNTFNRNFFFSFVKAPDAPPANSNAPAGLN